MAFSTRAVACLAMLALLSACVDAGGRIFLPQAEHVETKQSDMNDMASMIAGLLMLGGGSHTSASMGLDKFLDLADKHVTSLQSVFPQFPELLDPTDPNISPFGELSKVLAHFPDQVAMDHFAANYTHSFTGVSISPLTVFNYAPCLVANLPYGVDNGNIGVNIDPAIFYATPEGVNIEPEGVSIAPTLIYVGPLGENVQPQGVQVAPVLIAVAPIRHAVSGGGVSIAPTGIAFAGGKK